MVLPSSRIAKLDISFGGRSSSGGGGGGDDNDTTTLGRAWQSKPHPKLPLLATARDKEVVVYTLTTGDEHSRLTQGHTRSIRSTSWKPNLSPQQLCLATGSFDSTAALWRAKQVSLETQVFSNGLTGSRNNDDDDDDDRDGPWDLELVLEGHESEIKSIDFSPSGQYIATCSRDKSVWIWEDIGANEGDDDWECVAVLNEHTADVKAVAWCPEIGRRDDPQHNNRNYSSDVLASASYDDTVRIWRQDGQGEWLCVAVLEGHAGTVWGLQWEPCPRADGGRFPRLLTWSADCTIRVWTLKEEEDEDTANQPSPHAWSGLMGGGGIPNTMRQSLHEDWECTAVLPQAHELDIYSAAWSAESGLVASTGSDSLIVIYREDVVEDQGLSDQDDEAVASAELDGDDVRMTTTNDNNGVRGRKRTNWSILSSTANGHGPYEINHITWCPRYNTKKEQHDGEGQPTKQSGSELLVTTGDDGRIQAWETRL